ncbi:MAG: ankyrin repeat domain-containing protein [Neisseriaceae bacterium]
MFTGTITSWRDINNINQVLKGEDISSENRLKLFEQGMDYIMTSQSPTSDLLKEILGLTSTKCQAFKHLSIDNSFFFPKNITREIVYFLCICYIRQLTTDLSKGMYRINYGTVNSWVNNNLELKIRINDSFVDEVTIKKGIIYFDKAPYKDLQIKVSKLKKEIQPGNFSYTKKVSKLEITEIFHNHITDADGNKFCLGAVKYWLESIALAYNNKKNQRSELKNSFMKSLAVSDTCFPAFGTIKMYHKETYGYSYLAHIFNIYSSVADLPISLDKIIKKMDSCYLNQLYLQVTTNSHTRGIIIIVEGSYLKFMLYDPEDPETYSKGFIRIDMHNSDNYQSIRDNFKYLINFERPDRNILIKAYIPFSHVKNNISYEVGQFPIDTINDERVIKDILILAIINHDYTLVKQIFKYNNIDINYISSEIGRTPLILAIGYNDVEIVKLLLENKADINMKDSFDRYPIDVAKKLYNIEIQTILNIAGARTSILV